VDKKEKKSPASFLAGLATSVVLLDAESKVGGEDFRKQLKEFSAACAESGCTALHKAAEFLIESLPSLLAGDSERFRAAASCWLSVVQEACTSPPDSIGEESLLADIKKQFSAILAEKQESKPADSPGVRGGGFVSKVPVPDLTDGIDLLMEFIDESVDHLEGAEKSLLALETAPDNTEEINNLFRKFHTIKGVASFLNLDDIRILSHDTETMMDLVRTGSLSLNRAISDAVLLSIDSLRKLLALLKEQILNAGALKSRYCDVSDTVYAIRSIISQQPSQPQGERKKLGEILLEKEIISDSELISSLEEQQQEGQNKKIGEILIEKGAATVQQVERAIQEQKGTVETAGIKIPVRKLDDLIDGIGELVITGNQVIRNPEVNASGNSRLQKDLRQLDRIIREIQSVSMSIRLMPIRPVFQKMLRIIRDLAAKSGKKIDVRLTGEDTEIDKNIIEMISDPFVHMVRNAVDHGIEPADLRRERGKPVAGRVELNAYHKSGSVIIEIRDDGGGLNKEKILARAVERGLAKKGEALTEAEIFAFVFEPGFSTAEKVTDISGRGVGLDVVKRNIEQLMGKVEIASESGTGTTFIVKLPLTLAIIEGIAVRVGSEIYIVPIFAVSEFITFSRKAVTSIAGKGDVVMIHGNLFPVVRLDRYFNVRYENNDSESLTGCLVISDYGQLCIVIDELIGQQQVVIKSLGGYLKNVKGLAGATILGDGKAGLILDVNGIAVLSKGEKESAHG
jgi:two-component system, chemotaxis family, sensor kinase CheA